jgi:hypothetical protein
MYSWLFRRLPGPLWVRIALSVIILSMVLILLITFVFPWASDLTKFTESTVGLSTLTDSTE